MKVLVLRQVQMGFDGSAVETPIYVPATAISAFEPHTEEWFPERKSIVHLPGGDCFDIADTVEEIKAMLENA